MDTNIDIDDFNAQWRASAHEQVAYSNDFPECFLVLPELIDGAVAQGGATVIQIEIQLSENNNYLKVTDNGKGISNTQRLLSWASKTSTNVHHRYGHGSKKCLTKWNKDYNSNWHIKYRTRDRRGVSSSLFTYIGPFKGIKMQPIEDETDEINLMPSGLEWFIEFNQETLSNINSPEKIFNAIKEILLTRYDKKYFDKTEFIIKVNNLQESSKDKKWITFQECVDEEVKNNNCKIINIHTEKFNEGTMYYKKYLISRDGRGDFVLKTRFPTYGQKNMNCSRIHISLSGRTIEHAPYWKFIGNREANHNNFNGIIVFVNFDGDFNELPTPCTTKVSFYENCPNFIKFKNRIIELNNEVPSKIVIPEIIPASASESDLDAESDEELVYESESEPEPESEPKPEPKPKPKPKTPTKIKTPSKTKPKTKISSILRKLVWNTYIGEEHGSHKCLCCKQIKISSLDFICGHVKAESKGGKTIVHNLRPICSKCNGSMGSTDMIEFVKKNEFYIG
jgi:hypothetical protein